MKLRNLLLATLAGFCVLTMNAQDSPSILTLEKPDMTRGTSLMEALSARKSTREFSDKELTKADLSGLVWAANGINRPESGLRTAPSAMNKKDVKVYVCMKNGSFLYDPDKHCLELVSEGDARQRTDAPVMLVLVSDTKEAWGALDTGIVSQNISLYCAAMNLATVVRGSMDRDALKKALKLEDSQELHLNHPVGYFK